jgi:hypothetical protein
MDKNKINTNYVTLIFMFLIIIFILLFVLIYRKIKYDKKNKQKKDKKLIINKNLPKQIIFIHPNEKDKSNCWENFFSFDEKNEIVENKNLLIRPKYINKPDIIFIPKDKKYNNIENLANKLNININKSDYQSVVNDIIKYKNKSILVAWDYNNIPNIVNEIIERVYTHNICDISEDNSKLVWNYNPYNGKDNPDDFSTIWVINFLDNKASLTSYKGVYLNDDKTCNYNLASNNFQYQKYPCQNYFQIEYFTES